MNNLPNVKIPDNPLSLDIANMPSASTEEEETPEAREMETREDKGTRKEDEVLEETEEEMPPLEQISGKDIVLQIITKKA